MDILQAVLASGAIGALVGGGAAFLVARWQISKATNAAKGVARVVYLEIAQNIATLTAGQQFQPARIVVTRKAWDAHFGDLASLLPEPDVARVAAPYLQLDAYLTVFAQGAIELAALRIRRQDREVIDRLTNAFRDAEKALRPHVWTGERAAAMQKAIAGIPEPPAPSRIQVFRDLVASLPVWPFVAAVAVLQIMSFIDRLVKSRDRHPKA